MTQTDDSSATKIIPVEELEKVLMKCHSAAIVPKTQAPLYYCTLKGECAEQSWAFGDVYCMRGKR